MVEMMYQFLGTGLKLSFYFLSFGTLIHETQPPHCEATQPKELWVDVHMERNWQPAPTCQPCGWALVEIGPQDSVELSQPTLHKQKWAVPPEPCSDCRLMRKNTWFLSQATIFWVFGYAAVITGTLTKLQLVLFHNVVWLSFPVPYTRSPSGPVSLRGSLHLIPSMV